MNSSKIIIRNEAGQTPDRRPSRKLPAAAPEQPSGDWVYPSSANFVSPHVRQLAASTRKRRVYADYRELLALESHARKLNFLGSDSARSLPPDWQPQSHERALDFQEHTAEMARSALIFPPDHLDAPVPAPAERHAVLVVDQRMNMFFGSQKNLKSVVAAHVAALIAWQVLARKKRLSAAVFNDRKIVQFDPGCSRLHTLLILQAVLNQNHSLLPSDAVYSNAGMLNDALRRVSKRTPGNALIFLITDAGGCDQETLRLATEISRQNDLAVILVYDPQQAGFCSPSHFPADDSLSKLDIRKRARLLREKNQNPAERQRFLSGRIFPEGIPVIPLNTRDDLAFQLRRVFHKAAFFSSTKGCHYRTDFPSPEARL